MSALTMGDVAQYYVAFQALHGYPCTLSVDDMEQILNGTEDDDEDVIVAAMLDAMKPDGTETGPETSDRSDVPAVIESGSAWDYAQKLADPEFQQHLETNALAALENKRGGAVIRRDLVRLFGLEVIETQWPIPGSSEKTHPGSNRQLAKYVKLVTDTKTGETKNGEGDWYFDLYDGSPEGKALNAARDSIKAVKKGETGRHILPEHAALAGDEIRIAAEESRLDTKRATKKNAIVRAVNFTQKMGRLNTETEMAVQIITVDGTPEGEPVQSNKLIYAFNSKDRTKFRILTIGQMLALDVDKAKANGGAYQATIGTTGRKPKGGGAPTQNIKVETIPQYDDGIAAFAQFFTKLAGDTAATNKLLTRLNGDGSDDTLLSMNTVMQGLDGILSKPTYAKRLSALLAGDGTKRAALKEAFAKAS